MFTDLAVIDWIALAFAAVLLAAACAAAVIAYATSSSRPGPLPSVLKWRTPAHAAEHRVEERSPRDSAHHIGRAARPQPPIMPGRRKPITSEHEAPGAVAVADDPAETPDDSESTTESGDADPDRRLAERAARLAGRPVPEDRPSADEQSLNHRAMVQSVIATPAHAKTFSPPPLVPGVSSSNYDRAEGFKARTPGFFDDPMGRHELRYWDGHTWTEYVKEHGERFTDPL